MLLEYNWYDFYYFKLIGCFLLLLFCCCFWWLRLWFTLENVQHALEKSVYSAVAGKCYSVYLFGSMQVFYIITDFLSNCSINYWENIIEICDYNFGFAYLFSNIFFVLFILKLLLGIYTLRPIIPPYSWPLIMAPSIPDIILCAKVYFFDINITILILEGCLYIMSLFIILFLTYLCHYILTAFL